MHDQRSSAPAEDDANIDGSILSMLLHEDAPWPWTAEEVAREIGDPIRTTDSLARLYGAGLIHRLEGFVFPTRPAVQGERIAL